jgi:cytosine/adenosine deaminase-related metal-dependent hydrolase
MYRKLTAERIFDGYEWLPGGSVLIINEEGFIAGISNTSEGGDDAEHYEGILAPGMINAHCHLELSHLKGTLPEKTGLVDFLSSVIKSRATDPDQISECMQAAEKEMYNNGTMAVIDICNTAGSVALKTKSALQWHSLVEVINLFDNNLEKQWQHYNEVLERFMQEARPGDHVNLTPHAPYSVSNQTHRAINDATKGLLLSIHNQESHAENELFETGGGNFLGFYEKLGAPLPSFVASSKSSLKTYLPFYRNGQTLILVHNSFIDEEDIVFAKTHAHQHGLTMFYCLCPNANLFIEDRLPPVDLLLKHNCSILIGTDSYASNKELSVAGEIHTLVNAFPALPLESLLRAATSEGAKALGSTRLGSFDIGKKPGVVLLETLDGRLTGTSRRIT